MAHLRSSFFLLIVVLLLLLCIDLKSMEWIHIVLCCLFLLFLSCSVCFLQSLGLLFLALFRLLHHSIVGNFLLHMPFLLLHSDFLLVLGLWILIRSFLALLLFRLRMRIHSLMFFQNRSLLFCMLLLYT